MAMPIAATPVLVGEDAERFYRELEENDGKRAPAEEVRRSVEIFEAVVRKNPWIKGLAGHATY